MDGLRWILLGIGLVVLAVVYYTGRPEYRERRRQAKLARRRTAGASARVDEEPPPEALSEELERLGALIAEEREVPPVPEVDDSPSGAHEEALAGTGAAAAAGQPAARPPAEPDKVVVLYLHARGGRIAGSDILAATEKVGLEHGAMGIFHRLYEGSRSMQPIFSMANMLAPGTFDPDAMADFSTPGLALFASLPAPVSALDAFDAMLATGQRLAELLDAELRDDSHSVLTRQGIQALREEMREYDRARTLATRGQ